MAFSIGLEIEDTPSLGVKEVRQFVHRAENARIGYVIFRDSPGAHNKIDAVSLAAFAAPITQSLGLVVEVSTTYNEPFHTAMQLQALDFASLGRAGLLPAQTSESTYPLSLGAPIVTADRLAQEQNDSIRVCKALWDSWDDDAVIRDSRAGRFLDRNKIRHINFEGESFSVKGPSITPRSPQGQIPIFARCGELEPTLTDVVLVKEPPNTAESSVIIQLDLSDRNYDNGEELLHAICNVPKSVSGVVLKVDSWDCDFTRIGREVIPKLLEDGIVKSPRPGQTLREIIGLSRRVDNRITAE